MSDNKNIITKQTLIQIIQGFADKGIVYENEKQLQFDLGWEIKESISECEVFFEHAVNSDRRQYIDLIVVSGDYYYPIEIKNRLADHKIMYKSADGCYITNNQGASDEGTQGFVKDIVRIEALQKERIKNKAFGKGFVIMLSNYPIMWEDDKNRFENGHSLMCGQVLTSERDGREIYPGLKGNYDLSWEEYCVPGDTKFKYYSVNGTEFEEEAYSTKQRVQHFIKFLIVDIPQDNKRKKA